MIPNVLSIAGSDPSGGAGIQADIKSISANGAFAMAAITALTAQNTQGVSGIHLVPPAFVSAQIAAVFDDITVHAVKIGMIANAEIAHAVATSLHGQTMPFVLDPVMIAKGWCAAFAR
jgi:hydroxymethylpyrimidine/phosphomethylpyrimidine kinase